MVRLSKFGNCGGTLITSQHILTAAHCELFAKSGTATLGDHDAGGSFEDKEKGEVTMKIKSRTNHPKYWLVDEVSGYDISIWTLEHPVNYSKTIQPICLPTKEDEDYTGMKVETLGWGLSLWKPKWTAPKTNYQHKNLKSLKVTVLPTSKCKKAKWFSDRLRKAGKRFDETNAFCTGKESTDIENQWYGANRGDSGGTHSINLMNTRLLFM